MQGVTTPRVLLIVYISSLHVYYIGWKSRDSVPMLVDKYMKKEIKVDEFLTGTMSINDVNKAFDLMHEGKSIRTVVLF